jgi:phospholipase C
LIHRNRAALFAAAAFAAALTLTFGAPAATEAVTVPCGTALTAPPAQYDHVIVVMMENQSLSRITGYAAPYLTSLKANCGYSTNFHGATHPSAPNYVAMNSGIPIAQLPTTDCITCKQTAESIFNQVTWKAYQESMPTNCRLTKSADGLYVPRHNPATYFTSLLSTAKYGGDNTCALYDVPFTEWATDLAATVVPQYSFITPNLANDMHASGTVAAGDSWLSVEIPRILSSPVYVAGSTVIFITWDEGSGTGNVKGVDCTQTTVTTNPSCNPPLFVISPYTTPGTVSNAKSDHYSVLHTIEEMLGAPLLGEAATRASLRADFGL